VKSPLDIKIASYLVRFLSQSSREEDDGLIQNNKEMESTQTIENQEQLKEEQNTKSKGKKW